MRIGERKYFGNSDNDNNTVLVFFHYKAALVSVFEVETKCLVAGSLGYNALHFISLWPLKHAFHALLSQIFVLHIKRVCDDDQF